MPGLMKQSKSQQEKAAARAKAKAARCNVQACKVLDPKVSKLACACAPACRKVAHVDCYVKLILNGSINRCHFIESDTCATTPTQVVCSVKCYKKAYSKFYVDANARNVPWSKDGPNGVDDTVNSEAILLEWLLVPFTA